MGLDAISGVGYNDTAINNLQPTVINQNVGAGINITEVTGIVDSNTGNQTKDENSNTVSSKEIMDAISKANSKLKEHRTRCEFSYHDDTNRVSIKVIDRNTDKVIKEIPPEDTLKVLEKIWELAGILVDEKR